MCALENERSWLHSPVRVPDSLRAAKVAATSASIARRSVSLSGPGRRLWRPVIGPSASPGGWVVFRSQRTLRCGFPRSSPTEATHVGGASTLNEIGSKAPADKTAVIIPDGGPTLTYAGLREQVAALAGTAARGDRRGRSGGDRAPQRCRVPGRVPGGDLGPRGRRALNPAYKLDEFTFYMEDIGVKAVIVPPGGTPHDAAEQMNIPAWEARLGTDGRVALVRLATEARPPAGEPGTPRPMTSPCSSIPAARRAGPRAYRSGTAT